MPKPIVIVVHGMGQHTHATVKASFQAGLDPVCQQFSWFQQQSLLNRIELHTVVYDDVWQQVRAQLADTSQSLAQRLSAIGAGLPASALSQISGFITQIGTGLAGNSFLYTHLLDVILYLTHFGQMAQVRLAKQIGPLIRQANDNGQRLHFVAHSLGTAVLHDTLSKLYQPGPGANQVQVLSGEQLAAGLFPIASVAMLANVSRLVPGGMDPYHSPLQPTSEGICDHFLNARHVLDPFTLYQRFDIPAAWQSATRQNLSRCTLKAVRQQNVHALEHYLSDPEVYLPLFELWFEGAFAPKAEELAAARQALTSASVQGQLDALVQHSRAAGLIIGNNASASGDYDLYNKMGFADVLTKANQLMDTLRSTVGTFDLLGPKAGGAV